MVFDFDLEFLGEAAGLIDAQLQRLEVEAKASVDPDQFGVFDRIEYVVGFGFVACQQYVTATCFVNHVPKPKALELGHPRRCGKSIPAIVNGAANYWEHSSEWTGESKEERTRDTLSAVGVDLTQAYVASAVLHKLLSPWPLRFERVIPFLESWRDEIRKPDEATV